MYYLFFLEPQRLGFFGIVVPAVRFNLLGLSKPKRISTAIGNAERLTCVSDRAIVGVLFYGMKRSGMK